MILASCFWLLKKSVTPTSRSTPARLLGVKCRRVTLRISRTVFSALSGTRLLACLIVAPQRGYDEPGILSYAISSFCPTSADGLQGWITLAVISVQLGVKFQMPSIVADSVISFLRPRRDTEEYGNHADYRHPSRRNHKNYPQWDKRTPARRLVAMT